MEISFARRFFVGMHWLFGLLLLLGLGELGIGVLQSVRMFLYDLPYTEIRGTLNNPGPYSCVVVFILPVAWWYLLSLRRWSFLHRVDKCLAGVAILYVALSCFILPLSMSRASWVAALVTCGVVSFFTLVNRGYTKWILRTAVVFAIACLVFAGMFYGVKRDSADGRILIWKVSISLLKDHWIAGVCGEHFAGAYGDAQEIYFRNGLGAEREGYLAGAPEYAYNEYLQIWIEYGIVVFLCVLTIIGLFLYGLIRSPLRGACPILGCLVSILIMAFFSYPLRDVTTCILTVGILSLAIFFGCPEKWRRKVLFPLLGISLITFYEVCDSFGVVGYVRRAREQQKLLRLYYDNGQFKDIVSYYEALYPFLKHEPSYLFEYGKCLFHTKDYGRSTEILKEGLIYSADPMFLNIIGRNYQSQGNFLMAEKYYLKASFRIPHRLYLLYRLMLLYQEQNEFAKASVMAQMILQKEIKVPSLVVDRILLEAREFADGFSNTPTVE